LSKAITGTAVVSDAAARAKTIDLCLQTYAPDTLKES
jgi:hypothetical protein